MAPDTLLEVLGSPVRRPSIVRTAVFAHGQVRRGAALPEDGRLAGAREPDEDHHLGPRVALVRSLRRIALRLRWSRPNTARLRHARRARSVTTRSDDGHVRQLAARAR